MQVSAELIALLQPFATTVGALATLAMLSILWKENPIYRFGEHVVIGASSAHYIVVTFSNTIKPRVVNDMVGQGQYWQIVPIVVGLLLYFRLSTKLRWLARIPLALWVGYEAGLELTMRTFMPLFAQSQSTITKLIVMDATGFHLGATINNLIFFASFALTMLYFFYSFEKLNAHRSLLKVGRLIIMIAYGCAFGNGITGRLSLMLGRIQFLLGTWLGLI